MHWPSSEIYALQRQREFQGPGLSCLSIPVGAQSAHAASLRPRPLAPSPPPRSVLLHRPSPSGSSASRVRLHTTPVAERGAEAGSALSVMFPGPAVTGLRSRVHDERVNVRMALIGLVLLVAWTGVAGASGSSPTPIRVRVSLQKSRVVAGQSIKATVVLTNATSRPVTVESCAQNGWLQVGLKGHGYTYQATRTLIACPPSIRLATGANHFGVTVLTNYEGCLQPGGESRRSLPSCTSTGPPPPLPPGRYSTIVSIVGLAQATQPSRAPTVTLSRPTERKTSPTYVPSCPTCPTHPAFGPTPIRR